MARELLYRKLAEKWIRSISTGVYPVGSLLPSEQQLMKIEGVSRHTIRAALKILDQYGLIKRTPHVGTIVINRGGAFELQPPTEHALGPRPPRGTQSEKTSRHSGGRARAAAFRRTSPPGRRRLHPLLHDSKGFGRRRAAHRLDDGIRAARLDRAHPRRQGLSASAHDRTHRKAFPKALHGSSSGDRSEGAARRGRTAPRRRHGVARPATTSTSRAKFCSRRSPTIRATATPSTSTPASPNTKETNALTKRSSIGCETDPE